VQASLATVTRRAVEPSDAAFVRELFAGSREDLAMLPPAVRESLIDVQFRARRGQYAVSFPDARHQLIVVGGEAVGELLVDDGTDAVRIVDITVHEHYRGRGIAAAVLSEELATADRAGVPVRLSVWSTNAVARRLYERLGFAVVASGEDSGYIEMQRESTSGRPE
jgi:ribosomal protein S18 acetylase RimI-like enzyme